VHTLIGNQIIDNRYNRFFHSKRLQAENTKSLGSGVQQLLAFSVLCAEL
jgi:hypothetical protein